MVNLLTRELSRLRLKHGNGAVEKPTEAKVANDNVLDPLVIRTKGASRTMSSGSATSIWEHKCKKYGRTGHNKRKCTASIFNNGVVSQVGEAGSIVNMVRFFIVILNLCYVFCSMVGLICLCFV